MSQRIGRPVLVAAGFSVAALLASALLFAQPPGMPPMPPGSGRPQGSGPPGGFQSFQARLMIERAVHGSWAFVSFELDVSDEKLVELRKVYQENWEATKASLKGLADAEPDARRELMQGMMESQRELREKVKAALTDEQGAKLDKWYDQQRQQSMRGGGSRPRGGGEPPR